MTIVHVTHDIDEAVYLADRVLVLARRPGASPTTIEVALARPRSQTTTRSPPHFLAVRNESTLDRSPHRHTIVRSVAG